ncbi:MAG: PEGA domain-containing protein [Myxococcales bacterium]|nr:PEGA domain-containing protein [Myxococcales bacterium]MBL0193909.1 PEGA domain-containing protein [Myxococcales bacterium]
MRYVWIGVLCGLALTSPARAADPEDANVTEARALYEKGSVLGQQSRWADALAAFERSFKLRPHAATIYNVAQCFRATGQYARARATFTEALRWSSDHGDELPESLVVASKGHIAEIERLLSRVDITLAPVDATLAVDGAPLVADGPGWVAGVAPPGVPAKAPGERFTVALDPGTRVFTVARKGFQDVVVRETFAPGAQTKLSLQLDRLPALLHISANRPGALATVNDVDVGPVPLTLRRSAGTYRVRVSANGFVAYETEATVRAGEELDLRAALEIEKTPLTKQWWFWAATGAVVTGVAVTTYAVTRPDPERQALNGGGLGWTVPVR